MSASKRRREKRKKAKAKAAKEAAADAANVTAPAGTLGASSGDGSNSAPVGPASLGNDVLPPPELAEMPEMPRTRCCYCAQDFPSGVISGRQEGEREGLAL